ncbi:hypothetical protein MUK42_26205 [Musa troglodytarum]|uniref:Uncharacterized protein n=1 Tax=Musa troglodytarum TaxID=320322 RepID=A0A9E7IGQ3_9LILI|nr:hypothetical protein MUK42_26205 [Musa troglodytarum]
MCVFAVLLRFHSFTLPTASDEVDNEDDNSGEDMDKENEAYVHEAFLSDSETGSSNNLSYEISLSGIGRSNVQFTDMIIYHGTNTTEKFASSVKCFQVQKDRALNYLSSISNFGRPGSHLGSLPCPTRKCKGARVVKLAPGLPPINLPLPSQLSKIILVDQHILTQEVPTAAVARKGNQDSCNFNHSHQSMPIRQGSVDEEINRSSLGQSCQNPCHTLRLKPKHEDAKRDISSKSSQEPVHSLPGQFGKKARNPRSLKVQPPGTTPHAISPDNECSKIVAPRKRL